MTSEKLLQALGEIDAELIEEAMPKQPVRSIRRWLKYSSLAACLVLFCVVGIVMGMPGVGGDPASKDADSLEYAQDAYSDSAASPGTAGSSLPSHTQIIHPDPHSGTFTIVVQGAVDAQKK